MGNKASTNEKLFKAVKHGNVDKVRTLIEDGENVNVVGKDGLTPFQMSITLNNLKIIELLILANSDINLPFGHTKMTALHYAVNFNNKPLVQLLVNNGANIRYKDINGNTPFDLAMMHGYTEIIGYLSSLHDDK
jgi:ankyrin repeat protein